MAKPRIKKQQQVELEGMENLTKSESRFEKTADKLIHVESNKRKNTYQWTNDGEAFAHLFVQYRFDLDEEEAAQCAEVGRAGHDKGIDAYYRDEATETFYIVQTKSNRISHDEQILHEDVRKAIDFLYNDSVEGVKDTLREALEIFRETRQKRYDIVFVLGLNGSATKIKDAIPDFELQLPFKCQIEVFDVDDIRALIMRTQEIPESGPTVSFTLPAKPWELEIGDQSPKMISCVVSAKELGKYIRKHRLEIFRLNVREYLVSAEFLF